MSNQMPMNCSHCGAALPEDTDVCPSCGQPVSAVRSTPPDPNGDTPVEFDDLLTDIEDFFGQDAFQGGDTFQAWSPVEPTPRKTAASSASRDTPRKKKKRRRHRRWPAVMLVLLLCLVGAGGAYYWFFGQTTTELQGSDSCTSMVQNYLNATAIQGIQDPDQEKQEAKADQAALDACILPDQREDPDDTTVFVDQWQENYGKEVVDYALGEIQISDLSDKAEQVAYLEAYSGLTIQEVVLVPVSVNYTDGTYSLMNLMMVQSEKGYFLLSVE